MSGVNAVGPVILLINEKTKQVLYNIRGIYP